MLYVETPLFLLHIADEVQEKFKTHILDKGCIEDFKNFIS